MFKLARPTSIKYAQEYLHTPKFNILINAILDWVLNINDDIVLVITNAVCLGNF